MTDKGDTNAIAILLSKGASINAQDARGRSALRSAVEQGAMSLVTEFLNHEADPNDKDIKLVTPLHVAAAKDSVELVRCLIDHGARLDSTDSQGRTPYDYARASRVGKSVAKQMAAQNADYAQAKALIAEYKYDEAIAIYEKYKDLVAVQSARYKQGAALEGRGQLQEALRIYRQLKAADEIRRVIDLLRMQKEKLIEARNFEESERKEDALVTYAQAGAQDEVKRLALSMAKEQEARQQYITAAGYYEKAGDWASAGKMRNLNVAAAQALEQRRHLEGKGGNQLIESQLIGTWIVPVEGRYTEDMMSLTLNSEGSWTGMIQSHKIRAPKTAVLKWNVVGSNIHLFLGDEELIRIEVLSFNGDIIYCTYRDMINNSSSSAALMRSIDATKLHKQMESDLRSSDYSHNENTHTDGQSLDRNIHEAASAGNLRAVQTYVKDGVNIESLDSDGNTPLINATMGGHPDVIKYLLLKGADVEKRSSNGLSALQTAITVTGISANLQESYLDPVVKCLVNNGANVNIPDRNGLTPIMDAVLSDNYAVTRFLIENGADINAQNNNGQTPLMISVVVEHIDIVKLLLDNGADVHAIDPRGVSVMKLANHYNNSAIINLIKSHKTNTGSDNFQAQHASEIDPKWYRYGYETGEALNAMNRLFNDTSLNQAKKEDLNAWLRKRGLHKLSESDYASCWAGYSDYINGKPALHPKKK